MSVTPIKIPATKALTVMLVDGNTLVRSALARLLEDEEAVEVVATPESIERAASSALGHKPDVILFNPEHKKAVEASCIIEGFHVSSPDSSVLILTDREDPAFAKALLQSGANGYLLLSDDTDDLFKAVKRAAVGQPSVTPRIAVGLATDERRNDDDLTKREMDVIAQIALGYTNREMATKLHLSTRTVESHRANIMRKLGFHSRAEVVRYAMEHPPSE